MIGMGKHFKDFLHKVFWMKTPSHIIPFAFNCENTQPPAPLTTCLIKMCRKEMFTHFQFISYLQLIEVWPLCQENSTAINFKLLHSVVCSFPYTTLCVSSYNVNIKMCENWIEESTVLYHNKYHKKCFWTCLMWKSCSKDVMQKTNKKTTMMGMGFLNKWWR